MLYRQIRGRCVSCVDASFRSKPCGVQSSSMRWRSTCGRNHLFTFPYQRAKQWAVRETVGPRHELSTNVLASKGDCKLWNYHLLLLLCQLVLLVEQRCEMGLLMGRKQAWRRMKKHVGERWHEPWNDLDREKRLLTLQCPWGTWAAHQPKLQITEEPPPSPETPEVRAAADLAQPVRRRMSVPSLGAPEPTGGRRTSPNACINLAGWSPWY